MPQPRRKKRKSSKQEPLFGDWRQPVKNPADTVHMVNLPYRLRLSLGMRVDELRSAPRNVLHRLMTDAAYAQEIHLDLPTGWARWSRVAFALLVLLPLSVVMVFALLLQLYHAAPALGQWGFWCSDPVWFSATGALCFLCLMIMKLLESLFIYVYVLGHELTHALAVLLSFGRVHAFRVDAQGGYVETESDSLFIALSPYFIPLWLLLWLGVCAGVNYFFPFQDFPVWFYSGLGFWWSFHVYWTLWIIPREQPDLLEKGVLLSALLILLMNIGIMVLILRGFHVISLHGYWQDMQGCAASIAGLFRDLGDLCCGLGKWFYDLAEQVMQLVQSQV